ncbi:MAG: DNA mismatch repair protein [Polyangiaceae bacterium]|nr:DNA mismatch repair protein [Polyangiaceae bacterium]
MTEPVAAEPIPDLLCDPPAVRVDAEALGQALVFGFALGTSVDLFDGVVARASLPPTSWDRQSFVRDVFLDDLVKRALRIRIGGKAVAPCAPYLTRVLAEPPRDPAVVAFRQRIFAELDASPAHRADFERAYAGLTGLRALLCSERIGRRSSGASTQRRLEILRAAQQIVEHLAGAFEGATSGLARLAAFGAATRASAPYRRLEALLDHERHMGTLDLRVQVGADGGLSTFQIVAVRENDKNPFHASPLLRWLARLRLTFLGYRVTAGEIAERLLDDVWSGLERPVVLLFQLLGDMEFYLAGLALRDLAREKGLPVCLAEIAAPEPGAEGDGPGLELTRLYNPLLLAGKSPPVPCDLRAAHGDAVIIVTGPNSGGKTRLLQSVALAQLLGQSGMFVPAARARIRLAAGLFVSLIEDARSDQPEGQLGMELLRIRRLFEDLGFGSLVLLDELCSGTNPSEGEEIARLVISLLPELRSQVLVTTHLLTLAARLAEDPPVPHLEFLQVELDDREQSTYRFIPGVARTSLAHRTAARLGVTRDELLGLIAAKRRAAGG